MKKEMGMEKEMTRATLLGCACVVTSRLTVEQLEKYSKYHPESLRLTEEGSGKVLYEISLDDGPGWVYKENAAYSRTQTPDGKATITIVIDPAVKDKVEKLRSHIGRPMLYINEIENRLLEKAADLDVELQEIDAAIQLG